MKKLILLMVFGALFSLSLTTAQTTHKPGMTHTDTGLATEKQVLALRKAALAKELVWTVRCQEDEISSRKFYGLAFPENGTGTYIEDGAKPFWIVYADTQQAATLELTRAIAGKPNSFPGHKPKEKEMKCPLPLRGDPVTDKMIVSPVATSMAEGGLVGNLVTSSAFAIAGPQIEIYFDSDGQALKMLENNKEIVTIAKDGTVKVPDGVSLDDASMKFWKTIGLLFPSVCAGKQ